MTSSDAEAQGYALLDSGDGRKLERFGQWVLARPCAQAAWRPRLAEAVWRAAHASFTREDDTAWTVRANIPDRWIVQVDALRFRVSRTDFGHLGLFPEQRAQWRWIEETLRDAKARRREAAAAPSVLNVFAYSGGASLAAAKAGAEVCHVDASKGMVSWARENAELNGLADAPIRWIVDDAVKFLKREERRGRRYDAIILDPPTFGRGAKGEVYKIDEGLRATLDLATALLTDDAEFFLLTSHTPGYTPIVLANLVHQTMGARRGRVECGEMLLAGDDEPDAGRVTPLPNGAWARWSGE
jgi:23S rRNA (cytosine1962-C5)-methyltransferase